MTGHPQAVTARPVNGHPVPFVMPLSGPSSPWPPGPDGKDPAPESSPPGEDAGAPVVTPPPEPSRDRSRWPSWRRPDGAVIIRMASSLAVLAVSAIAAVISYSHIYALALATREFGTDARLLPLSVDGLILASSLTLLDAARRDLRAPVMAYLMLAVGVGATIAANVQYGLPYGWKASCVAAWPAVAFIGSVEVALRMSRSHRRSPVDGTRRRWWRRGVKAVMTPSPQPPEPPAVLPSRPPEATAVPVAPRPARPSRNPVTRAAKTAVKGTPLSDEKIAAALTGDPSLADASIPVMAKAAGVSASSVERYRKRLRESAASDRKE